MRKRRRNPNTTLPGAAGWYRIGNPNGEYLRYFDGFFWSSQTRSTPFWLEGPEWAELVKVQAEIDSDEPKHVVRRLLAPDHRPLGDTQHTRSRVKRSRHLLAITLFLVLGIATVSSYAMQMFGASSRISKSTPAVPLLSETTLVAKLASTCTIYKASSIAPIGEILSGPYSSSKAKRTAFISKYSNQLTSISKAMNAISNYPADQSALSSWQGLWTTAVFDLSKAQFDIKTGKPYLNAIKTLQGDLSLIDDFAIANNINSCDVFSL
ncbi:hypothetical protein [Acidithrix ferrooxidans]|uniref:DUF2510 domain-containing protein n=1 Tax=Acidithrix ferrooxidans TaxID=1280514 RepID=A0A0D8HKG4_9ACTN|nr:hypothetical protein [Acidithrix ferrooxidans]KJF18262.1 hypothetical protein AXFE_08590 [Acidithrix ferrooxidans]